MIIFSPYWKKPKKIGLFFGSFNPIHRGHIAVAELALKDQHLDEVWFVVSPVNPFKAGMALAPEHDRAKMLKLALREYRHFKVSTVEFDLSKPSYTEATLKKVTALHPRHAFYVLVGTDVFNHLPEWKNSEYVMTFPFIVYVRNHEEPRTDLPVKVAIIQEEDAVYTPLSSTILRNALEKSELVDSDLLHPKVAKYISKKQLYQKV